MRSAAAISLCLASGCLAIPDVASPSPDAGMVPTAPPSALPPIDASTGLDAAADAAPSGTPDAFPLPPPPPPPPDAALPMPEIVHDAAGAPIADLARTGATLSWTESGSRWRACALPACASPVLLAAAGTLFGEAIGEDYAYALRDAAPNVSLVAYRLDGGGEAATLATFLAMRGPLALDGGNVLLTMTNYADLMACARSGGCGGGATIVAPTAAQTTLVAHAGAAYWTESARLVRSSTAPSSTPEVLAYGQSLVGLVLVGGDVIWSDSGAGTVLRCVQTAGDCSAAPAIAHGQSRPMRVASDGTGVYWTNSGDGTIVGCPSVDCVGGPTVLARDQPGAAWIAVDDLYVYWAAGARILRVPKA